MKKEREKEREIERANLILLNHQIVTEIKTWWYELCLLLIYVKKGA